MGRLKYGNPFTMGNLVDLFNARMDDDVEYLKEWSQKAVEAYEKHRNIEMDAFKKLIDIKNLSSESVDQISRMLREI